MTRIRALLTLTMQLSSIFLFCLWLIIPNLQLLSSFVRLFFSFLFFFFYKHEHLVGIKTGLSCTVCVQELSTCLSTCNRSRRWRYHLNPVSKLDFGSHCSEADGGLECHVFKGTVPTDAQSVSVYAGRFNDCLCCVREGRRLRKQKPTPPPAWIDLSWLSSMFLLF